MPVRIRPTAPIAGDAILVGDPGRALLLAQELLEAPKMSNHARGLWGYFGSTPSGTQLTIQSTGIGGPSAALVLADLAALGVQRAIRVGTCTGLGGSFAPGDLVLVERAVGAGGSVASLGLEPGSIVEADRTLTESLRQQLGPGSRSATVVSLDAHPSPQTEADGYSAADMQTASLLARAGSLEITAAAVLIVETALAGGLNGEERESAERRAGRAAAAVLSNPQVEG